MPNPFQDDSPSSEATAPVAADTVASSRTASSSASHRNRNTTREQQLQEDQDQEDEGDRTKDDISMRENPLIYLTKSQREAAVENLEIESTML